MDSGGMSMGGGMDMGDGNSTGPLSAVGVDFTNATQAADFLADILDDDELKIIGNTYAEYFWYGVIVLVAVATLFNVIERVTLHMRLRAAAQKNPSPARPQWLVTKWIATITAISREITYLQWTPTSHALWFKVPPLGTILLICGYFGFVLALEFINNTESMYGAQYWQALGVRAGWLAVAQVPLLVLLVNKNNVIGLLTGVSYERLNVLHRWSARVLLLLAIFHFAFQSHGWQIYGLMQLEWDTDTCPPTGIAAFALLLWMNLSTLAPFRFWSYEFFVVQHIITFFGFIIAVMMHLPTTALGTRMYIYLPVAFYLLDRIVRTLHFAWINSRPNRATLTQLDNNATLIRVKNSTIKKWRPGSHVLLSIPRFGILQSHPATILSSPASHNGEIVFILKTKKGFTKRIMNGANNSTTALLSGTEPKSPQESSTQVVTHRALLDGPHGGMHADLAAFDSVCVIVGATGITFGIANLLALADRVSAGEAIPLRYVHLVWCVRDSRWAAWVQSEISTAYKKLQAAGIEVQISVHVTCADALADYGDEPKECGCACDKSQGPCCCVAVVDDDDEAGAATSSKDVTIEEKITTASSRSLSLPGAVRLKMLPCAAFYSGRPAVRETIAAMLETADGESAVVACGPIGLNQEVRQAVVSLSDERAIHKGTGAQGCYLHVESFS